MFFLVPLAISVGAFYLALTTGDTVFGLVLTVSGTSLLIFAAMIAKIEVNFWRWDRSEADRLRQEEADINELINDTSDFLREVEANEARTTHAARYEGGRT